MRTTLLASAAVCAIFSTNPAMADGPTQGVGETLTIEQVSQSLRYSASNDRYRIELAPNYSEELGFSMKGAAGAFLTDEFALGLIIEYGANSSEYLANAGIQFTDALSLVGSVGLLEQNYEYTPGDGRKSVQQMEYGASLKGAYEAGVLSGFELNGYLATADTGSDSVETGDLYGVQLLADLDLTDTTRVKVGGGYEWLEWDEGGNSDSVAFSAEATQQLGDMFSLNGNVKLGASEYVYGGGLALDLGRGSGNTNALELNYEYIQGQNGVQDDQRVELSWSYGFGSGPTQVASVETQDAGAIRPTADVATLSPANNLLNDVTKRPSYLPQTVVAAGAKPSSGSLQDCSTVGILVIGFRSRLQNVFDVTVNPTAPDFVTLEMQSPASPTSVKLEGIALANVSTVWGVSMDVPGEGNYTLDVDGTRCLLAANFLAPG